MRYLLVAATIAVLIACGGSDKTLSEDDYLGRMVDIEATFTPAQQNVAGLFQQVIDRPALITNSDWNDQFDDSVGTIEATLKDARGVTPPDDLEAAHGDYLKALECMSDYPPMMRDALLSGSSAQISNAMTFTASCRDLWDDAIESLTGTSD